MDLSPQAFFDLTGWEHASLFDEITRVWEALERIEPYLERHLKPGVEGSVETGAWIVGDVYVGPGARVEAGAMIQGPAIIGAGTVVRHGAYIRGGCIVGSGCVVGHATELKRAVLLDKAQAPHFNYVGDSILGRGVNLGAGVKLSNFKNDGSLIEVDTGNGRIPTGQRKLGAILGDGVQIGCNSVTSPGTLVGPGTMVYANVTLRGVYPPSCIVKVRHTVEVVERRRKEGR